MNSLIDKGFSWIGKNGIKGQSFYFEGLDIEEKEEDEINHLLSSFIESLDENVRVKISLFQDFLKEDLNNARNEDILERGFLKSFRFIHFEDKKKVSFLDALLKTENLKSFKTLNENINKEILREFRAKEIKPKDFCKFYDIKKPFQVYPIGLKTTNGLIGILRLKNPSNHLISFKTLALRLNEIPKPFEFHITLEKLSSFESEKIIKHKTQIEKSGTGQVSYERYKEAELTNRDITLNGANLYRYEAHIVLKRAREKYLKRDIALLKRALAVFGDWSVESFGSISSMDFILPGRHHQNLNFLEVGETLKYFLPFVSYGKSKLDQTEGLIYHRSDLSLDVFNPYSKNYSNHSGVIVGRSGKGKSVLTNLITKSLYENKKNHIFLIDVKGSHKRLIDSLKGKTFNIDIKNPSGLSPMGHLKDDKISIEILSDFIEKLLLDEKETSLSNSERISLERNLISFSKTKEEKTLDNFYKNFNHKRKTELSKWIEGGLNEFIFKEGESYKERLLYFNFENLSTASNSRISKAIISSVLAEFQFRLLSKKENERFIFISDETPFFIKNSFETFSLLSKNVRKLNGSLILIAQNSNDLILNKDTSLIDNSEFKILFSTNGEDKRFKELFSLTESEFLKVKNLKTIKNRFSSFLIKDSLSSKIGFLRLSQMELMISNTEPDFLFKVNKLKEILKVNTDKALEILSHV